MKLFIYNYNGSKKKQIMFVNLVALSIAVLVLVGQINIAGAKNVGLGNHILKEGKVNLAVGSMVVATNEDIEQYKSKFPNACDVDFDNEGNIVLHYKSQGATKDKGCTVDLLTNMKNNIVFTTGLSHSAGLENCLTDINQNTLPFAYSLKNEEISQLHNGPIFGNGGCCEGTCVKRTGLEVSWELQEKRETSILVLNVNPIGVALIRYTGQELPIVERKREYPTVMITYQFPRYRISYPKKGNVSAKNSCVKNIHQNILPPITWEIDSTRLDPRMNRLLVFHLLPQRASRIREWLEEEKRYKIQGYPPQGPDCDDLNIKFSKRSYKLINVLSTPETTKPPTDDKSKPPSTTNEPPSTSNDPLSTSNNPTNNNQISSTIANGENNSTTSTPKDTLVNMKTTDQVTETSELGTSTAFTSKGSSATTAASTKTTTIITTLKSSSSIGLLIVVAVILIIIVIGVSVYFFVIRKKPDKKGKDVEGGDEAKGDGEEEDAKKEENGKEKEEDEGDKSKDEEEDGDKSKEDDEEDDKKEVKGSESKTDGETKEVESLSPEEKRIEDEIY
ncbi:unnamed protein product [Meloidogyne enterolobii]|uniref:Uncharacterized protein n=1 Tax=Meloidogyne enterolobii TaxID=390850 RepID=A0ACB0Y0X7_MELEN